MQRFLVSVFLILLFSGAPSVQASSADAGNFINRLGQQVLDIAKTEGSDTSKQEKLRELFFSSVDVDWIGRFVLGRFWRTASMEQQQRYLQNYRHFIATNYTSKLKDYTGETYKIGMVRDEGEGKYLVSMLIQRPQGESVSTDYRVKEEAGVYKIYDIIVEGVSLITTQRSEFSSAVSRKGLDFLITQLEKKAKKSPAS